MGIQKLIKDVKSELPETMELYNYKAINNTFHILNYIKDTISITEARDIMRMTFEYLFGLPYENNDWLYRIYEIIDGGLIKP